MDTITIISLVLSVLGVIGSIPALKEVWTLWKYNGVRIKGKWNCKWQNGSKEWHYNETIIKQRGPKIRMYAFNEWNDVIIGKIVGNNFIEGTYHSTKPGIVNFGVFILKIKGKAQPEIEGHFLGLDDEGNSTEVMYCNLIKAPDDIRSFLQKLGFKKQKQIPNIIKT